MMRIPHARPRTPVISRASRPSAAHALGALAICAGAASALPPKAADPGAGDDLWPASLRHALSAHGASVGAQAGHNARPRPASGAPDLSGAFGGVSRGASGADGALSTFDSAFESLPLLPANIVNTSDTGRIWGGAAASITGSPRIVAVSPGVLPSHYGVVADPIAGNATKKLRGLADPAFGPNQFFGRWLRYDLFKTNSEGGAGLARFLFRPDAAQDVRVVHDTYVTSITSLWTSEPTNVTAGLIVGRLVWGGLNETSGIGLPIGPIPHFYVLCNDPWFGLFCPCVTPSHYRSGQPYPTGPGLPVDVPVNRWFKIIHETTTDGLLRHVLDLNDGNGEFVIYEASLINNPGRVDRMAFAGQFDHQGDAMYVDNLHIEGVEFVLPTPPPLECVSGVPGQPCGAGGSGQYVDDQRWLFPGPLAGQGTRWVDALSSRANVIVDGEDHAIERSNWFNDDRYRQEIRTLLPLTVAQPGFPFRICIEVDIPSSAFPYSTVQGVAPASVSENEFVSRLFIGRFDPANPPYTPRMYVQIKPGYNPIDDESAVAPYQPGPNGNGGVPVIGVDVADTGVNWSFNGRRDVCFRVDNSRNLTLQVAGVPVFVGQAFTNSIDQLHLECENNQPGIGNTIVYDDVVLTCAVLPAVTLPPFSLVYTDDLQWGIEGVTISLHDDDCNPNTPFKWSSAPNMPIVTLNIDGSSKVLKMENLFRDTPAQFPGPAGSGFSLFHQASTQLPHVTGSPTRGWVARCANLLTDTDTTRTWAAAHAVNASVSLRGASLALSSISDTFWVEVMDSSTPDPSDTTWVDTGSGPGAYGSPTGQWFSLSIHRNLNQKHTFRINGRLLRYAAGPNAGAPVFADTLQSPGNGPHKNLDRLFYYGSDEDSAPVGSILYTDNIRVWSLPCQGDTNNDGVVNFADLNDVLGFFGQSAAPNTDITGNVAPDANNDGVPDDDIVNFADLNVVLSGFGVPCTGVN